MFHLKSCAGFIPHCIAEIFKQTKERKVNFINNSFGLLRQIYNNNGGNATDKKLDGKKIG